MNSLLYNLDDTIAAISTPPGVGGIGVIRISGPAAIKITQKIFFPTNHKPLSGVPSHNLRHGHIEQNDKIVDETMVSIMRAPRSYTGDDVVEISAHGGQVTLKRILGLVLDKGARAAGPGEFTFRAFSNGKLDLARAEAVADLISSKTALSAEAALSNLSGAFSLKIQSFRAKLLDLLSSLEAALDHAEEDITFISADNAIHELEILITETSSIIKSFEKSRFLKEGLKAVITGRPNVGKSSLLNALLEKDRSIVTDVPGTTRDTIEETADINGFPVILTDTAGLRAQSSDPVEKIGQERALEALKRADIIIWVLDSSQPAQAEDIHISNTLNSLAAGKTIIPVWNKSDLPCAVHLSDTKTLFPPNSLPPVKLSAKTSTGLSALEDAITSSISFGAKPLPDVITVNARHVDALKRSQNALFEASDSIKQGFSEEIQAHHIRESLNYLGEITGETATEEILSNIFARFCVGK
jgi:tRNA modification GTPase